MVGPDQSVVLWKSLAECERICLSLHESHVLRLGAERELAARFVIANHFCDLRILLRHANPVVRPYVVDLAVEHVCPVEHGRDFRSELFPLWRDRSLVERHARWVTKQVVRDELELLAIERLSTGVRIS